MSNRQVMQILPIAGIDATSTINRHHPIAHLRFVVEVNQIGQLTKILVLNSRAANRHHRPDCSNSLPQIHVAGRNCGDGSCDCRSLARLMLAAGSDLTLAEYWSTKCLHPCEAVSDGMLDILLRTPTATFVVKRRIYDDCAALGAALRSSKIGLARRIEGGVDAARRSEVAGRGCRPLADSRIAVKFDLNEKFNTSPTHDAKLPTSNPQSQSRLAKSSRNFALCHPKEVILSPSQRTKSKTTNDEQNRSMILKMTLLYGTSEILPYVLELMLKGAVRLTNEAMLDLALINADPSIMQYLLYEGICDVNQKDEHGYTALHKLVDSRMRYCNLLLKIQTLLNSGADINAKTKIGQTVFGLVAKRYDHYAEIIECLIKNVALLQKKGRRIDCNIWNTIEKNPKFETYYNKCRAELEMLQTCYIHGAISLYSILVRENIVKSVKNRRVMLRFTLVDWYSISLEKRFPIYYSLLKSNFFEMKSRVDLIKNATSGLERILMLNSDAFYHIFEKILDNLRYEDLASLYRISRLWYCRMRENPLFQQARSRGDISIQSKSVPKSIVLYQKFGSFLLTM